MKFRNFLLISLFLMTALSASAQLKVTSLTTDYKTNPLGIDNPVPQLSWIIQSDQMNTMQESYEIRAALTPADLSKKSKQLWNSETVASSQSIHIEYGGQALNSHQRVYWQVRVVDNHGKKSKWSDVAFFEMGKLESEDWVADWITPTWEEDPKKSEPSPYLRKEFALEKSIKQARLYITCQGLYQVEINGERVGDQEFTPGWTSYDTRLQYQTYDITSLWLRIKMPLVLFWAMAGSGEIWAGLMEGTIREKSWQPSRRLSLNIRMGPAQQSPPMKAGKLLPARSWNRIYTMERSMMQAKS